MTDEEQRNLFKGTMTAVRGALRRDGNEQLFEDAWTETDPDLFIVKLERFAIGLAKSARRFYRYPSDKIDERIASDVKVVADRVGWHWGLWRIKEKGSA